ncbi:MAG: hypothetical protein P8Y01_02815 [Woeseiaceae bacterium]|jgi:hypothetical protein
MRLQNRKEVPVCLACFLTLGFLFLLSLMQPLRAADQIQIRDFQECRSIESNATRLLCYDTIADGGVYGEARLEQVRRENFGSEDGPEELSAKQLPVTIVRVQQRPNRVYYFHTADGAVWRQTGRGTWSLEVPFQAEIKEGVLGSFFLVTEGGKSTRVKRAK